MINIFVLIALAVLLGAVTICKPELLASNTFLMDFIDHEAIALLAVILTITLASIANIHLSINRVLVRTDKNLELIDAAKLVKKETKDDAWFIFTGFVFAILLVIYKGSVDGTNSTAFVHAAVLWIYGLYLVCLFDIHRIIFGLADLELHLNSKNDDE